MDFVLRRLSLRCFLHHHLSQLEAECYAATANYPIVIRRFRAVNEQRGLVRDS